MKKKVKIVVDNKLKGAFAETDLDTGLIRVNRKKHFDKKYKMVNPTGNPHKDLASTVQHELLHVKHPRMKEMNIRKLEKQFARKMTPAQQKKLLSKLT